MIFAGVDIGGGSIKGSLITRTGEIINECVLPTNKFWNNEEYIEAVSHTIATITHKEKPQAIGIGSPGPLDINKGLVIHSTNLPNLDHTDLVASIFQKFSIPVFLNNDANCAALGEYYFGTEKKEHSLVVLTLGTGLGGGWVYKGKLFSGLNGNAMEAGHVTIIKDGALCGCGKRGCAESYFSAAGLLNRYEESTGQRINDVKEIFDLAILDNQDASNVVNFGLDVLAELVKNIIHLINPDRVVFVGGLTRSWDFYSPTLIQNIKAKVFPVFAESIRLEKGNNVAGSFGAAALAFTKGDYL